MSAITLRAVRRSQYWITYSPTEITWEGLMQHSPHEIKEKLLKALDKDNNVVNMGSVMEVITVLEKMQITKEALERTRLGKYINELRKKTKNETLARRAKKLVRSWQKLILPCDVAALNGERERERPSECVGAPNSVPTNKSGSPATMNHKLAQTHANRNRSSSPIRVTSPIDSYCSSTSTSPALAVGHQGSRPGTPSAFAPKTKLTSPDKDKDRDKEPSATANANANSHRLNDLNDNLARHTQNDNNHFYKHRNAKSNDKVICSTHSLNVDVVAKTNAANKRLRKENSNSNVDEGVDGPPAPAPAAKKTCVGLGLGLGLAAPPVLTNGNADTSNDSTRSDENETKVPQASNARARGNAKVVAKPKEDNLKEKLTLTQALTQAHAHTHGRANKVKTTAQLIEDLRARNTNASSLLTCPGAEPDKAGGSRPGLLVYPRRGANNVLDGDHDMNKTKNEMMEKFLLSSVDVDGYDNSRSSEIKSEIALGNGESDGVGVDPVEAIMARLPPLNVDEIVWEDDEVEERVTTEGKGEGEGEGEEVPRPPVTEDALRRLHAEPWQCVNGNFDHEQTFREWHQALSLRSCNNELLHILPYVNIE